MPAGVTARVEATARAGVTAWAEVTARAAGLRIAVVEVAGSKVKIGGWACCPPP